jgi:hypothetical protein
MTWEFGRQDGGRLMTGYEIGDSIHGHRIIAETVKVSDHVVVAKNAGLFLCAKPSNSIMAAT